MRGAALDHAGCAGAQTGRVEMTRDGTDGSGLKMATGSRKFLLSIALIAVLLAGGMMVAGWLEATKPPAQRSGERPPPPLVSVRPVIEEDIREYFTGYGSARAEADALLASEVTGVVVEVAEGLKDGAHVEAGQLLVSIDDRQYRQQLARQGRPLWSGSKDHGTTRPLDKQGPLEDMEKRPIRKQRRRTSD